MEIEFQNTRDDYKSYYKIHFRNEVKKQIIPFVIIPIVIGGSLAGSPFVWGEFFMGAVISIVIVFTLYCLVPYTVAFIKFQKIPLDDGLFFGKKKITVTDEGLIIQPPSEQVNWKWEKIPSIEFRKWCVYFPLADNKFILIPTRFFSSESDVLNFLKIVRDGIHKKQGTLQTSRGKSRRYLWALFCLIPVEGVVVGTILFSLGVFYYKDKRLSIAAGIGIAFSVFILYQFQYGGMEGYAQIAQWDLNRLVHEIEFYKIENGVYPDNLDQLRANNQSVSIYDPSRTKWYQNVTVEYNYKRIGGNYYLYSSGIDGKPKTSDDIFPMIASTDSNKIGWRRWR